jgi:hypothetical protein
MLIRVSSPVALRRGTLHGNLRILLLLLETSLKQQRAGSKGFAAFAIKSLDKLKMGKN